MRAPLAMSPADALAILVHLSLARGTQAMPRRWEFSVSKMDCPSEERLIRMALEPLKLVDALTFDLRSTSSLRPPVPELERDVSHAEEEASEPKAPPADPDYDNTGP